MELTCVFCLPIRSFWQKTCWLLSVGQICSVRSETTYWFGLHRDAGNTWYATAPGLGSLVAQCCEDLSDYGRIKVLGSWVDTLQIQILLFKNVWMITEKLEKNTNTLRHLSSTLRVSPSFLFSLSKLHWLVSPSKFNSFFQFRSYSY